MHNIIKLPHNGTHELAQAMWGHKNHTMTFYLCYSFNSRVLRQPAASLDDIGQRGLTCQGWAGERGD